MKVSPVMLPYKSFIIIDAQRSTPLYLQLSNELIKSINKGILYAGLKLPGSRKMAQLLSINRGTVVTAYEELDAQGWLEIKPNKGCFVNSQLPYVQPKPFAEKASNTPPNSQGFKRNKKLDFLTYHTPIEHKNIKWVVDAGYPDVNLAPLKLLSGHLNGILKSKQLSKLLNYSSDFEGDLFLRKQIIAYLSDTRSIHVGLENIMITRGSLMAFYNIFQVLLEKNETVIVGAPSFHVANDIIRINGGNIQTVKVDEKGIDVEAIERICKKSKIRAVFIMPHHHNPTTVTLSAERRMKLLMLAKTHCFAVIEDDYDYDFHYSSSPILPLASADQSNAVIYVGSLSKTVAPGLRMGFVAAPAHFIKDMARLSRFIDCHGNMALERAIAYLFMNGDIRRHMKKSVKMYKQRRDYFCHLLNEKIGNYVDFQKPEGGLAVWVNFKNGVDVKQLREQALSKGLQIPKPNYFNLKGARLNAIRMGFASLELEEMEEVFKVLEGAVQLQLTKNSDNSTALL